MARTVKEYTILISCPSDIKQEKNIIKRVIEEFNRSHSYNYNVIFNVVEWKLGTYSSVGENPQSQINKQIVDKCDMAVALFGTRAGVETENNISGTVEEIERLRERNKQVFLYFSSKRISLNEVDFNQYNVVLDIKKKYEGSSLYKEYKTLKEFEKIFVNEFNLYVSKNISKEKELSGRGLFNAIPDNSNNLQDKINQAQYSIFLAGASMISTLSASFEKCAKLENIRILITKEDDNLIKECAKLSYASQVELKDHVQSVKRHFHEMILPDNMEIKCIDAVMPCSVIGIDIDKPTGRIYVRQYLYGQHPVDCPRYVCYYGEKWYDMYLRQIYSLWEDCEEIDFNNIKN